MVGSNPPQKPWEKAGAFSGPAPFKPPSAGSTSDVVEASGTVKPGEVVSTGDRNTIVKRNTIGRPVPARPWEQQTYGSTYGGINSIITPAGSKIEHFEHNVTFALGKLS
ncbi:peroxisomal membrane protein 13-like [Forsythia ovata]|uniref:Peroxin-13 n=1 Tax=Forsythia ovata TaxID=205694 RepID=A0ABD1WIV2_9LAMI